MNMKEGHLEVLAVRGKNNPADLFTKAVSGKLRESFLQRLGFEARAVGGKQKATLTEASGKANRFAVSPAG